jgi:hypothetical protein
VQLENRDGLPWTASLGRGWLTFIVVLTGGVAMVALGIYLALWIRSKGRSALPAYGLFLFAAACLVPESVALPAWLETVGGWSVGIVWFASIFALRHEIKEYFRERGFNQRISPFFTVLLSSTYLNYCLNPVTLFDDEVISLNVVPNASDLRK